MTHQAQVVAMGEVMALAYPPRPVGLDIAESLMIDFGGAEGNLCIALSRLGITSRLITRIGKDPLGVRLENLLRSEEVLTDALIEDPEAPSGFFFREHLPDGRRRVYYYRKGSAASRLNPEDLRTEWFEGCQYFHLTGITPALSESCRKASLRAVEIAKSLNVRFSFDPNYRAPLWSPDQAKAGLAPFFELADIVLIGNEDARAILGMSDPQQILDTCARKGEAKVVLKLAEKGAQALIGGEYYTQPVVPARQVIDPVGAGDGFDAGFLAGLIRGWEYSRALELAARIGSAAVEVMGDYAGYPRGI